MENNQTGISVFRVALGEAGQWDVTEEGLDGPIASFYSTLGAQAYARALAKINHGSTVRVFDERGTQMPAEGSAAMPR